VNYFRDCRLLAVTSRSLGAEDKPDRAWSILGQTDIAEDPVNELKSVKTATSQCGFLGQACHPVWIHGRAWSVNSKHGHVSFPRDWPPRPQFPLSSVSRSRVSSCGNTPIASSPGCFHISSQLLPPNVRNATPCPAVTSFHTPIPLTLSLPAVLDCA
jgi:hypothetical protein